MAKYTATLNVRVTPEELSALEWWSNRIEGWNTADLVRHFLRVPNPEDYEDPGDLWEDLQELRAQAEAELEKLIEFHSSGTSNQP